MLVLCEKIYRPVSNASHFNRGATPVLAIAARATTGFSGVPMSGDGLAPSSTQRAFGGFEPPLQALKNAPHRGSVFHTRHLHTPRTATRAKGQAEKTLRGPRRSTGYPYQHQYRHRSNDSLDTRCLCCSRGPRRVFSAEGPSHAMRCEGCGGGRVMNARPVGQRCLALAKRSGPAQPKALPGPSVEGASAARTQEHRKNPE